EAVASIVGSADSLATLLALVFAIALLGARERTVADAPFTWATALVLAAIYALAIGAKESAATIPALGLATLWGWDAATGRSAPSVSDALRLGWRVWI